jgi:Ser/Thr protein kinase RdoA (MazF antagonist)
MQWHNADVAEQRWAEFLSGYREKRSAANPDLAAVPLLVVIREVWLMGLHARTAPIHGQFMLDDAMLNRRFAFLKTWEQRLPT